MQAHDLQVGGGSDSGRKAATGPETSPLRADAATTSFDWLERHETLPDEDSYRKKTLDLKACGQLISFNLRNNLFGASSAGP